MARLIGNVDATGSLSTSVPAPATNASAVSLYLPFDSNINDASANGHSVTSVGSAGLSSTQAKFGANSLSLNGSSQYLTVADNDAFNFQSEDFTVEVFVHPTTLQQSGIYSQWESGSNRSFKITMTSSGAVVVNGSRNGSTGNHLAITSSENLTVNNWHHIAAVCSNSTVTLYINGKNSGSGGIGGSLYNSTNNIAIGANIAGVASNLFAGFIDDLRVTKGIALYSQNFVPPSQAVGASLTGTNETNSGTSLTSLYLPFDSDINDDGPGGHTVTAVGDATVSSTQSKFGGSSLYLDGSGDRLNVSSNVFDEIRTSDFTIEMFFYPTTISNARLWSQYEGGGNRPLLIQTQSAGNVQLYIGDNSGAQSITISNVLSVNTWYHVAVTRVGSTVTLYFDGTSYGSLTISGDLNTFNQDISIGARGNEASPFEGYIDDLRVVKHGIYTGDFTPPTSALTASSSQTRNDLAVLYLPFDSGVADKARNHPVTAYGNAAVSATQAKFGGKSLALDGTGDYLTVASGTDLQNFNSLPFTIEGFFYCTNDTSNQHNVIMSTGTGSNSWNITVTPYQKRFQLYDGTTYSTNNTGWTVNTWHHFAVCFDGSTLRQFIDGAQIRSDSYSNLTTTFSNIDIGRLGGSDSLYFNGYLDDITIIKGFAKYTAAFTPPSAASGGEVLGTTTDSRTFSSVWNLNSPEVTEAFKAGTWPTLPVPIAWDTTTAGSDVAISNSDLTAAISGSPASWAGNAAISVGSYSSGKIYFEATISGSPSSGYLRVGVVQNKGSATLTEIQSGSMTTWDSDAPAYTNKSENRSQPNGAAINDGSNTHSNGDVFMWAFDIDNARAYFGRNGSFDLSFDPVNGTGGYDMSSLSGYNSTDPWHILFQNRNSTGTVTLRTAAQAQYLPAGYSYWGTV